LRDAQVLLYFFFGDRLSAEGPENLLDGYRVLPA
jgi:hypothetical protein